MNQTAPQRSRGKTLTRSLRILDVVDQKFVMPLVIVGLIAMAMLISADTFYRYVLDDSLEFVPKVVTKVLMVVVVFGGLNQATRYHAHVRVDFVADKLPSSVGRGLTIVWNCVILLLLLGIAFESYKRGAASNNPLIGAFDVPIRVSLYIVTAGCVYAAVRQTVSLLLQFLGAAPEEPVIPPEEVVV